jgi:hypothetical protein
MVRIKKLWHTEPRRIRREDNVIQTYWVGRKPINNKGKAKMARKVFFSFHHKRDAWRAGQVRNSGVTKGNYVSAGFLDAASWEEVERQGSEAIKRWINQQLDGTSVTAVLIGYETSERPYVLYEIEQSILKGNGLVGIYIHNLKDKDGRTDNQGDNPFDKFDIDFDVPVYEWWNHNGYDNLSKWIDDAAREVGR